MMDPGEGPGGGGSPNFGPKARTACRAETPKTAKGPKRFESVPPHAHLFLGLDPPLHKNRIFPLLLLNKLHFLLFEFLPPFHLQNCPCPRYLISLKKQDTKGLLKEKAKFELMPVRQKCMKPVTYTKYYRESLWTGSCQSESRAKGSEWWYPNACMTSQRFPWLHWNVYHFSKITAF